MKMDVFTKTTQHLPIFKYQFGNKGPRVLLLGGVHGDEPEGVIAAQQVLAHFIQSYNFDLQITVIPEFNPEGILNKQRTNSNGVDLNRNLPTKDWSAEYKTERYFPGTSALSEPENKALVQLLEKESFDLIISLHSWNPMINVNGTGCEPEAEVMKAHTGYIITTDIGYPTPGSLGTYGGKERDISTITFEIQRDIQFSDISKLIVPALLAGLKQTEKRTKK